MSTFERKPRPIEERIADLVGRSTYRVPHDGLGGIPDLTDQDIAAALVWCRKNRPKLGEAADLGPELLMTQYAGTEEYLPLLRGMYLRLHPVNSDKDRKHRVAIRRMAATIAVKIMAGTRYNREQLRGYAYIVACRTEDFRDEVVAAGRWLEDGLHQALEPFKLAVSDARDERTSLKKRKAT